MSTADPAIDHLDVAQDVFAGARFWAALDRLAHRRGHGDHPRILRGTAERTERYEFRCISCDRVIATMDVQREAAAD